MKKSPPKITAEYRPLPSYKEPAEIWWYISFSGATSFLGAAFVRARSKENAIAHATATRIRPAGVKDTLCLSITAAEMKKHVPASMRDRLLNEAETRKIGGKAVGE